MGGRFSRGMFWLSFFAVSISAPSLRADLVADPISVDFGDVAIVHFSMGGKGTVRFFVEVPVEIQNRGVEAVKIMPTLTASEHFEIRESPCPTLDPGAACPIRIRYGPRQPGGHAATLTVQASGGEEIDVPLWGDAVEVICEGSECDGPALDFGSAGQGEEKIRILGLVNETGAECSAMGELEASKSFSAKFPSPEILGTGDEMAAPITCTFSGDPGPLQGFCVWHLPPPMLPVVRDIRIPLVARVNGCLASLDSIPLPPDFVTARRKKGLILAASRYRKRAETISRRLLVPGIMGVRPKLALSRIRYKASPGIPQLDPIKSVDLGGREMVLGMVRLRSARPKKIAGDGGGLALARRIRERALALSRRRAIVIDLPGRRKITAARLEAPFDGVFAASRLRQTRAYAVRRREKGPSIATIRLRRVEGSRVLEAPRLSIRRERLPEILDLRATSVRALDTVVVPGRKEVWREKLVAAVRYRAQGPADLPEEEQEQKIVLLLLGEHGRDLDAWLIRPSPPGMVTSLAARRKKSYPGCLQVRKTSAEISAVLGLRSGRLEHYRARRSLLDGQWSWNLVRESKLPHPILDLRWKGEDVHSCGEVTQDLIALGRRDLSLLRSSGHVLELRARRKNSWDVLSCSRPRSALPGESRPIYLLEKRPKEDAMRITAYTTCEREQGGIAGRIENPAPYAFTGDLVLLACPGEEKEGAWLELEASGYDPEGDPLHYSWTAAGIEFDDPTSPAPRAFFPLGETTVYLVLRDGPADNPETRESTPRILRVLVDPGACPLCEDLFFDVNADGKLDVTDVIDILKYLFTGGDPPPTLESADLNGDGFVDVSDPIYLLFYLYMGGSAPVCPGPS